MRVTEEEMFGFSFIFTLIRRKTRLLTFLLKIGILNVNAEISGVTLENVGHESFDHKYRMSAASGFRSTNKPNSFIHVAPQGVVNYELSLKNETIQPWKTAAFCRLINTETLYK